MDGLGGLAQAQSLPSQQFVQTRCGHVGYTSMDGGKPSLRVNLVEAASRDHRQHGPGPIGFAQGADECPISVPTCYAAQGSLRGVVAEAEMAVVKETGEFGPALEHVVDRFQSRGGV